MVYMVFEIRIVIFVVISKTIRITVPLFEYGNICEEKKILFYSFTSLAKILFSS